jgi:hypothetical protein
MSALAELVDELPPRVVMRMVGAEDAVVAGAGREPHPRSIRSRSLSKQKSDVSVAARSMGERVPPARSVFTAGRKRIVSRMRVASVRVNLCA